MPAVAAGAALAYVNFMNPICGARPPCELRHAPRRHSEQDVSCKTSKKIAAAAQLPSSVWHPAVVRTTASSQLPRAAAEAVHFEFDESNSRSLPLLCEQYLDVFERPMHFTECNDHFAAVST